MPAFDVALAADNKRRPLSSNPLEVVDQCGYRLDWLSEQDYFFIAGGIEHAVLQDPPLLVCRMAEDANAFAEQRFHLRSLFFALGLFIEIRLQYLPYRPQTWPDLAADPGEELRELFVGRATPIGAKAGKGLNEGLVL